MWRIYLVVCSDDDVVTTGMHIDGRNPFSTWLQDLDEFLLGEIVAADGVAGGDEEDGFRGVELCGLRDTLEAAEGELGEMFRDGMDGYCCALAAGLDRGEVVSSSVPVDYLDCCSDFDLDENALVFQTGSWTTPLAWCCFRCLAKCCCGGLRGCVTPTGVEDLATGLLNVR